jgi:hypothetical protein
MGKPPAAQYTVSSPAVYKRLGQSPPLRPRARSTPSLAERWKKESDDYKPLFMPQRHVKVEPCYDDAGRSLPRLKPPDYKVPKAFTGIP